MKRTSRRRQRRCRKKSQPRNGSMSSRRMGRVALRGWLMNENVAVLLCGKKRAMVKKDQGMQDAREEVLGEVDALA